MKYKSRCFNNVPNAQEALKLVGVILSECYLQYEEEKTLGEDSWEEIATFCKEWGIPLNVALQKEILKATQETLNNWEASSFNP